MYLKIKDGKIYDIGRMEDYTSTSNHAYDATNMYVLPGFIDEHIHGAGGSDVMDATPEALETISENLLYEGVTSYLATTMTETPQVTKKALQNLALYFDTQDYSLSEILGVHLEGPYISHERSGGQNPNNIRRPDLNEVLQLNDYANGLVKLITYAPEETTPLFTKGLVEHGIVAAAGHSSVSADELSKHIDYGLSNITHLFNAMSPVTHRNPGLAFAGLSRPELTAELIADGHHVDPHVVTFAINSKGASKIVLVSDSMRAKNRPDGEYVHGGMQVMKKDGVVQLPDGTLSGSVLHINDAVKNVLTYSDCSLSDIVAMTSQNQAKKFGCADRKGDL
jgi:N-acetylglucosamine-6-phosphate deacetylase